MQVVQGAPAGSVCCGSVTAGPLTRGFVDAHKGGGEWVVLLPPLRALCGSRTAKSCAGVLGGLALRACRCAHMLCVCLGDSLGAPWRFFSSPQPVPTQVLPGPNLGQVTCNTTAIRAPLLSHC